MKLKKFAEQKYKEYKNVLSLPEGEAAKFTAFRLFDEKVSGDIVYLHFLRDVQNGWRNMQIIAYEEVDENTYKPIGTASYKYGNFIKQLEKPSSGIPHRLKVIKEEKKEELRLASAHLSSFEMFVYWENSFIDVVKTIVLSKAVDISPEEYMYHYNDKIKKEKDLGSKLLVLLDEHKLMLKIPKTQCNVSYNCGLESMGDKNSEMVQVLGFDLSGDFRERTLARGIGYREILNIKRDALHLKKNISERATVTHEATKQIII